ncbi:putative ankyrin-containing lipoprotein Lxx09580 [Haliotis rufescens]|uniref:putative ankyrin-containing lipoprotein Lxx09580 n=1 Tax=Haliotis rufescens TaxID=6454 RepID=UPI00201E7C2D|nr:putative ankyrin-containing lipoprotein Lxx09580 [Haliotis rufescens]
MSKSEIPRRLDTLVKRKAARDYSQAAYKLHKASMEGDLAAVNRILAAGLVDINSSNIGGRTPLMEAARWGRSEIVQFLVRKGADVSLVDDDGNNTLHWACDGGYMDTVKFVLSQNIAEINARNVDGETAADMARFWGYQEVVDLLVSSVDQ